MHVFLVFSLFASLVSHEVGLLYMPQEKLVLMLLQAKESDFLGGKGPFI